MDVPVCLRPLRIGLCLSLLQVYHSKTASANSWTEVSIESSSDKSVTFQAQEGGIYYAKSEPNIPLYAGIAAACFVVFVIVIGAIVYFHKHPEKWSKIRKNTAQHVQYAKRSFQAKV